MRLALVLLGLAGCVQPGDAFICAGADECGAGGTCESSGYCSFFDASCPSLRRYGDASGALSGVCVPDDADGGPVGPDASIVAAPCSEGFERMVSPVTGHCYLRFATGLMWAEARDACAALVPPAYLAVITGAVENAEVASILGPPGTDQLLGGTDAALEGSFVWITGDPFDFHPWRTGEPNNEGPGGQDCLAIHDPGTWNDRACNVNVAYVCERDP